MPSQAVAKRSNGHGGSRVNAGRKTRGLGEKTRIYAAKAAEEGVKPIDVMLGNMRYFWERADGFEKKLEEVAKIMTPEQIAKGGEEVMNLLTLIKDIGSFRSKAQECAVDAAPYVHPRLTAVAVKIDAGDSKKPMLGFDQQNTPMMAADAYARMLAGESIELAIG